MVSTLLALELERARAPEWASDEAAGEFVRALLDRRVTDRGDILARAGELAAEIQAGGGVVIARAAPRAAQTGDRRARVLIVALRSLRAVQLRRDRRARARTASARPSARSFLPQKRRRVARAAQALARELAASLPGFHVTVAHSRWVADPVDLYRSGQEALLAVNVAEAEGLDLLAFEDTGSYRLLLPAMSEDPARAAPLLRGDGRTVSAYDEQYETELVPHDRGLPGKRRQRHPDRRAAGSPTGTRSATGSNG